MSSKIVYLVLTIFCCLYAVAVVFLCLYFFGGVIVNKPCDDGNFVVDSGTLGNYVRRDLLQPGEKLFITIELKKTEMKPMEGILQPLTVRPAVQMLQPLTVGPAVQNLTMEERRKYVIEKLLLNKTYCGQQHWDEYYHTENETNGYEANIYEFPWLVSLANGDYRCNGFLISNRYFITTEECFRRGYHAARKPTALVEVHNIQKKISCIQLPDTTDDCTTGVKELRVQEGFKINSITLVKLSKGVPFSNFIRPICLPLEDHERPSIDDRVMISGWGRLLDKKDYVSIKKRNRQKVISVNDDECQPEDVIDSKNWICTLPLQNSTTVCLGDDGSPTMYMYKDNWFAAGVTIANSLCMVEYPVFSIAITREVVNHILDVIYNDYFKSHNGTRKIKT